MLAIDESEGGEAKGGEAEGRVLDPCEAGEGERGEVREIDESLGDAARDGDLPRLGANEDLPRAASVPSSPKERERRTIERFERFLNDPSSAAERR